MAVNEKIIIPAGVIEEGRVWYQDLDPNTTAVLMAYGPHDKKPSTKRATCVSKASVPQAGKYFSIESVMLFLERFGWTERADLDVYEVIST